VGFIAKGELVAHATLITDFNNNRIVEVDQNDNPVWQFFTNARPGSNPNPLPTRAVRLRNGDTLISDQFNHHVIEVNPSKVIVASYGTINSPGFGPSNRQPDECALQRVRDWRLHRHHPALRASERSGGRDRRKKRAFGSVKPASVTSCVARGLARRVEYAPQRMDLCGRLADGGGVWTETRIIGPMASDSHRGSRLSSGPPSKQSLSRSLSLHPLPMARSLQPRSQVILHV
jgi:hypothetical protein